MVLGKRMRKWVKVLALTLSVTMTLGMLPAASARAERIEAEEALTVVGVVSEMQEANISAEEKMPDADAAEENQETNAPEEDEMPDVDAVNENQEMADPEEGEIPAVDAVEENQETDSTEADRAESLLPEENQVGGNPETQNNERTITFTPTEYDITEDTIKVQISTNATDCYLAAYVYNQAITGTMTPEEWFEEAVKADSGTSMEVQGSRGYVYVWYVDGEGNRITEAGQYDASYRLYPSEILCKNESVAYVNGDALEDWDPQVKIEKGVISWNADDDRIENIWVMEFGDGKVANSTPFKNGSVSIQNRIIESGEYGFYFWGTGKNARSKCYSVSYTYRKPDAELPSVSDIHWVEGKSGVIEFTLIEDRPEIGFYNLILYAIRDDGTKEHTAGRMMSRDVASIEANRQVDFSNSMHGESVTYAVSICVFSKDIESVAHSKEVFSEEYDPSQASGSVTDILSEVLAELGVDSVDKADADDLAEIYDRASEDKKAEMAEALKGALGKLQTNELKVAMQTSEETRKLVKTIEDMQRVTVNTTVSDDVKDLIAEGSLSVLGAGLNADEDTNVVTLSVSKAPEMSLDWEQYKKNPVALGITLTGCSKAASGLDIPVTVTMSVPKGIDMSKLVILHMKADGTVEEVLGRDGGYFLNLDNRTVTFTVVHFSTFIFAETADEGEDEGTGDGNTGNEGTGDGDTGNEGTGDGNTGNEGTGDGNTGNEGTGDGNIGNEGTGDGNTGNEGAGDGNTVDEGTGSGNDRNPDNSSAGDGDAEDSAAQSLTSPRTSDESRSLFPIFILFGGSLLGIVFLCVRKWKSL